MLYRIDKVMWFYLYLASIYIIAILLDFVSNIAVGTARGGVVWVVISLPAASELFYLLAVKGRGVSLRSVISSYSESFSPFLSIETLILSAVLIFSYLFFVLAPSLILSAMVVVYADTARSVRSYTDVPEGVWATLTLVAFHVVCGCWVLMGEMKSDADRILRKRKAEEDGRQKAEEAARRETRRKAEEEVRRKAEEDARRQVEEEARRKAKEAADRAAEEERKRQKSLKDEEDRAYARAMGEQRAMIEAQEIVNNQNIAYTQKILELEERLERIRQGKGAERQARMDQLLGMIEKIRNEG